MSFDNPATSIDPPAKKSGGSKWILILVLVLVVIGLPICACGGCIASVLYGVTGMIKGSEPYRVAVERAEQSPEVRARLGEPVTAGMLVTGNINLENSNGECDLQIPLSGPNGSGTLTVRGSQIQGEWTYDEMSVEIDGEKIDLQ